MHSSVGCVRKTSPSPTADSTVILIRCRRNTARFAALRSFTKPFALAPLPLVRLSEPFPSYHDRPSPHSRIVSAQLSINEPLTDYREPAQACAAISSLHFSFSTLDWEVNKSASFLCNFDKRKLRCLRWIVGEGGLSIRHSVILRGGRPLPSQGQGTL
jgi:hypothetical protein